MENNRVSVKIYGQEYTIAGEKSREHIIRVADHVDSKMHEIAKSIPSGPVSALAVLSAVNIADEYFSIMQNTSDIRKQNEQLEKDTNHYIQLWDEAKKSFLQYKEDTQQVMDQKEEMQVLYNEKVLEFEELKRSYKELEEKLSVMVTTAHSNEVSSSDMKELELKYKDIESSFFDIQMENIQLKGEIDRYKKLLD
ncbi:MAG: cell division protein ZapA [Anaerovorax sp.]